MAKDKALEAIRKHKEKPMGRASNAKDAAKAEYSARLAQYRHAKSEFGRTVNSVTKSLCDICDPGAWRGPLGAI